ncbi:MAG: phosphate ABC transporter permease subunit PstC [Ginsengibacter sp.]
MSATFSPSLRRKIIDSITGKWMMICLGFFLLLPLLIGGGLIFKSMDLIRSHSISSLLFSSEWYPMQDKFGFLPFIVSSLSVTGLAVLITIPLCLFPAIYLSFFAHAKMLKIMRPVIDILAGIPSVVYGVWGVIIIVPLVGDYLAPLAGKSTMGYSLLAGAIVLAIMSIPYILNMLLEVFRQIPSELAEASLSLGATKWETIKKVFLKKGAAGMLSAFGLGFSKALGETIALMMVVGNVVQMPKSVFDAGYPLPALVANNYGEMMSIPSYESALMFGSLLLLIIIISINIFFRFLINKYESK